MSTTIDNRVVGMEFDNARFEQRVRQTITSLGNLNGSLNALGSEKATSGFAAITNAANNVDLSNLESGVSALAQRFSALGIAGMTVITRLTNGLIDLGKTMARQIINGGIQRAKNIEQAKFQIEGLAQDNYKTWESLQGAINNAVSGTAYGFDEAAKAASQFFASGISDASDMEKALTGISGLAAMTGSSYGEIADIMTTVAGNGRLMSQQLLQFSSRGLNVAATLADQMGKSEKEVRDMVTKGQISFKEFAFAMNDAFGAHATTADKTFTGAMSNVKAALSRIGAAFVSPLIQITEFNDEIWNLVDVLTSVKSVFNMVEKAITSNEKLMSAYKNTVGEVSKTVSQFLRSFIEFDKNNKAIAFVNFQERLGLSDQTVQNLKDTFNGIKSAFSILTRVISSLFGIIAPTGSAFSSLGSLILSVTGAIGRFITFVDETTKKSTILNGIINLIKETLSGLSNVVSEVIQGITDLFSAISFAGANRIEGFADNFKYGFDKLSGVSGVISGLFTTLQNVIRDGINGVVQTISGGTANSMMDLANSGILGAIGLSIKNFIDDASEVRSALGPLSNIKLILEDVRGVLEAYQQNIQADTLKKIATAIAILAGSLLVISLIDSKKLLTSLIALGSVFYMFQNSFTMLTDEASKLDLRRMAKLQLLAVEMIALSSAILILSGAVRVLGSMDVGEAVVGIISLQLLMHALSTFADSISQIEGKMLRTSLSLVVISGAFLVLTQSIKILGSLDLKSLAKGILGLGIVMAEVSAFMLLSSSWGIDLKTGAAILLMAAGLELISDAIKRLSGLSISELTTGLSAIAAVLAGIAWFSQVLDGVDSSSDFLKSSAALTIMAIGIKIIADAMTTLGGMSGLELAKSLTALAGSLLILSFAMSGMSDNISGAAAMLAIATSIRILAPALVDLGNLPLKNIGRALLALGGAIGVFAAAAAIATATGIISGMYLLAGSIAALGIGIAAFGTGVFLFATGLTVLAASAESILASIPVLVAAIIEGVKQFIIEIVSFIPDLINAGLAMLTAFLQGVRDNLPMLVDLVGEIIVGFLDALANRIPDIIDAGFRFLEAFIVGIVKALRNVSGIAKEVSDTLSAESIELISRSLMELSVAILLFSKINFVGALNAIIVMGEVALGLVAVLTILGGINKIPGVAELVSSGGKLLADIGYAIGNFIGSFVGGIGSGLTRGLPSMANDISDFMISLEPFFEGAKNIDPNVADSVKTLAEALKYLIDAKFKNNLTDIFGGGTTIADFGKQLNEFVPVFEEFANRTGNLDPKAVEKVKFVAEAMSEMAKAANEIPNTGGAVATFVGDNSLIDFARQLSVFSDVFEEVVKSFWGIEEEDIQKVGIVAEAAKKIAEMAKDIPNTGGAVAVFTGDNSLTDFAGEFIPFIESFKKLAEKSKEIDEDAADRVQKISNATNALIEMAKNIPNTGGIAAWVQGDNTLEDFAMGMVPFIEAFKTLVSKSQDFTEKDAYRIKAVGEAAKVIVDIAASLPNSGGIVSIFTGDNMLWSFANELTRFAAGFSDLAKAAHDISDEDVEKVHAIAASAKAMAEVSNALPKVGIFNSPKGLDQFANELTPFAENFKALSEAAGKIPEESISKVTAIAKSAKALSDVSNSLPKQGVLTSPKGLDDFAQEFVPFVRHFLIMSAIAMQIPDDGITKVTSVMAATKTFSDAAAQLDASNVGSMSQLTDMLPSVGLKFLTFSQQVSGIDTKGIEEISAVLPGFTKSMANINPASAVALPFFVSSLPQLGSGIKSFAADIQGIDATAVGDNASKLVSAVKEVAELVANFDLPGKMQRAGQEAISALSSGISSGAPNVTTTVGNVVRNAAKAVRGLKQNFSNAGKEIGTGFIEGLKGKENDVKNAGKSLGEQGAKGASGTKGAFHTGGENAGQGFINGLNAKQQDAYNAGYNLGKKAKQGQKDATGEASPAKQFIIGGEFAGEGFVIGLMAYSKKAYSAGFAIGLASVDGANAGLLSDFQDPVITPVLDLSRVATGASQIGTLLNSQNGMRLSASINDDLTANPSQDLLDAINKMSSKLDELSRNNQQIDPELLYDAVRAGASDANIGVQLNNRELTRELRNMGVNFA